MPRPNEQEEVNASLKNRVSFNTFTAGALIVFAGVLLFFIPDLITKPKLLMGRSLMGLKPTLFPYIAATLLLLLSIWYLVISLDLKETNLFKQLDRSGAINVIVSLAVFLGYALLMVPLGFIASSIIVMVILSFFFGNRNILLGLAVGTCVPVTIYFTFTRLLSVSLPEFPFF
mgnify:CR=1 FL=1